MVAKKTGYVSDIYFVTKIEGESATCVNRETREESVIPLDELVTIAQFGEPIYPYLKPIDTIAKAVNMHRSTVNQAIKRLEGKKLLIIEQRKRDNGGTSSNLYRIEVI